MMRPPRRVGPARYRRHSCSPSSLTHATAPRPRPAPQVGLAGALRRWSCAVAAAGVPDVRSPFSRSDIRLHVRSSAPSIGPGCTFVFTRALSTLSFRLAACSSQPASSSTTAKICGVAWWMRGGIPAITLQIGQLQSSGDRSSRRESGTVT